MLNHSLYCSTVPVKVVDGLTIAVENDGVKMPWRTVVSPSASVVVYV